MKRGIVAAPGIVTPLPDGLRVEMGVSVEDLNYYILYWDEVVIPGNNLIYIGVPGEDELIKCGAIARPRIAFHGSFGGSKIAEALLTCQAIAARELMKSTEVDWVIHQIGPSLSIPKDVSEQRNVLRIALANALPVPAPGVPVVDILEFKERRRDELAALHASLDAVYEDVLRAPDSDLASRRAIAELRCAVEAVRAVTGEKLRSDRNYSLSVQFGFDGAAATPAIATGALIDLLTNGFTMPLATAGSALLSSLKITSGADYTFGPAHDKKRLSYLSNAKAEEIL